MARHIDSDLRGPSVVNRKKESEQAKRQIEVHPHTEKQPASWVQKYLDLADVLMRRRKQKREQNPRKAA